MFLENYLESIKNITSEDKEHTNRAALEYNPLNISIYKKYLV